jgi:hypothetical protein
MMFNDSGTVQKMSNTHTKYTQSIFHAAAKVDAAGFLEVLGWAGNLCNFKSGHKYL